MAAAMHIARIRSAIAILDTHPEIGRLRAADSTIRELVICRGRSGYIALYEFSPAEDMVRVPAIHHQRESGYRDGR